MPKKIKLEGLKVQSFITSPEQKEIRGGATLTQCQFPTAAGAVTCDADEWGPLCAETRFTCGPDTCTPSCRWCCVTEQC